jgi:chromosome segregation ATPase
MKKIITPLVFAFLSVSTSLLPAGEKEEAAAAEARLREALRSTTLQLREAQNQVISLQAQQGQLETEKAELKIQAESLNKQIDKQIAEAKADKAAAEKNDAGQKTAIAERDGQIARLKESLEKWKAGYNQVVELAKGKEAERAQLFSRVEVLERLVDDREMKNTELFKIGNEILTRYEKFSLGDALAAKEPFTGFKRARLEALVQDYKDKLVDQKTKPEPLAEAIPQP